MISASSYCHLCSLFSYWNNLHLEFHFNVNQVDHNDIPQVTFIEALDQLMPGFDPEIGKLAQRVLINPRKIDYHTGVFASKVVFLFIFVFFLDGDFSVAYLSLLVFLFIDHSSQGWKTSQD